jgi:hypothetical protein
MFTRINSDRYLSRVVAGLAITVAVAFGALMHTVASIQPMI